MVRFFGVGLVFVSSAVFAKAESVPNAKILAERIQFHRTVLNVILDNPSGSEALNQIAQICRSVVSAKVNNPKDADSLPSVEVTACQDDLAKALLNYAK